MLGPIYREVISSWIKLRSYTKRIMSENVTIKCSSNITEGTVVLAEFAVLAPTIAAVSSVLLVFVDQGRKR